MNDRQKFKDIRECIYSRHSSRNFKVDGNISKNDLEQILEAGLYAPSPKNIQPWSYIVYSDKASINNMARLLDNSIERMIKIQKSSNKPYGELRMAQETAAIMKSAQVLVIVCYDEPEPRTLYGNADSWELNIKDYESANILSIGASVENMLLMAEGLGIASLWVADILHAYDDIVKCFNINKPVLSVVLFGKADLSGRRKKTLAEKVEWRD